MAATCAGVNATNTAPIHLYEDRTKGPQNAEQTQNCRPTLEWFSWAALAKGKGRA